MAFTNNRPSRGTYPMILATHPMILALSNIQDNNSRNCWWPDCCTQLLSDKSTPQNQRQTGRACIVLSLFYNLSPYHSWFILIDRHHHLSAIPPPPINSTDMAPFAFSFVSWNMPHNMLIIFIFLSLLWNTAMHPCEACNCTNLFSNHHPCEARMAGAMSSVAAQRYKYELHHMNRAAIWVSSIHSPSPTFQMHHTSLPNHHL